VTQPADSNVYLHVSGLAALAAGQSQQWRARQLGTQNQ